MNNADKLHKLAISHVSESSAEDKPITGLQIAVTLHSLATDGKANIFL